MVKNSKALFFYGGLSLLALLAGTLYLDARHVPVMSPQGVFIVAPLIILVGIIAGWHFARQDYLGRVLKLEQLREGGYKCNKNTESLFWLDPHAGEENPRFIRLVPNSSTMRIPLGADFTLKVSTEKGREFCAEGKKTKRFTRRLFKAYWKDFGGKGGFSETQWSFDV